ncbi:MAG: choice-of-anchor B family protein [Saprospiraceae bacterium]|nr:choice-of-anchor B family protein [Saprospiraceae bacterium]
MNRLTLILCLGLLIPFWGYSQISSNMNLLDHWDDNSLPLRYGAAFNDIWGYTDPSGNEYALIGAIEGVFIFDVTNNDGNASATYPVEVEFIAGGSQSLWRDIKTYQNYAYAVADEGSEGLIIIDLSNVPSSASIVYQSTASFTRAHNIFIDEAAARIYVAGSNTHSQGLIVLDISNPVNPVEISTSNLPAGYVHDVFVRGDTAYCSHGTNDGLYVYNYANAGSPAYLGSLTAYPDQGYNHSSWLTADGNHLVFADETKGKGLKIADVSNLNAISVSANNVFRSTLEGPTYTNSVAHNPFIVGDYVYISYYHDGVQVFDISNPANVVNAGYFDTNPSNTDYSGWDGCWGVYPFLPSGNIIASDQLHGLFVLKLVTTTVPVELIDFQGYIKENYHLLEWETATESNSAYYEVERSRDGENFTVLGKVAAQGNTLSQHNYQFIDENPLAGSNYYRLRMVDQDGTFEYSHLLHLLLRENTGDIIRVYPNIISGPRQLIADHDLSQSQKESLVVRLLDANGRVVLNQVPISDMGPSLYLDIPTLPTGIYFLEIRGKQTNYLERITVNK